MSSRPPEFNRPPGTVSIDVRRPAVLPPAIPTDEGESGYYAFDERTLSFRQLWRMSWPPNYATMRFWVAKILQRRPRVTAASAMGSIQIREIAEVPERVRGELAELLKQCAEEGLVPRFAAIIPSVGDSESYSVLCPTRDRAALVQATYGRIRSNTITYFSVMSRLRDAWIIATSSFDVTDAEQPPFLLLERMPRARLSQLLTRHAERLAALGPVRAELLDDLAQRQFVLDMAQWTLEFRRRNGSVKPVSRAEVARLRAEGEST
jgi:hypothetical protein